MAKLKLAPFTRAMSGKLGNVVFSKTKEGTIMRERITPKNPSTPAQVAVRSAFSKATKQWANLSATQLQAWELWAKSYSNKEETTEKTYSSDAFNAFVKLAAKWYAVNASGTAPTTPPTAQFDGDTPKITATVGTGLVTFNANAANSAGVTTALLLAKLGGKNRKANPSQYREKKYFVFATGALTTTVPVPAGWYAAGYSFINLATGQESEPVLLGTIGAVSFEVSSGNPAKGKKAA